ncbi:GW dipeptide domain-containing protein [Marinilactibacillus sp. XAAS-LB27]|uniref:GW dipeptide domain-containing protein n=1 Tax=Marinilactibacillus sp. XAAS-LB27 TaxID=3114538 RepID=UPI002E19F3A7|nr:GW dipeptide domain-containing protein [Marinilactibacillus sp. XAAS-LB27]
MKQLNKSMTILSVASLLAVNIAQPMMVSANSDFSIADVDENQVEQNLETAAVDFYEWLEIAEEAELTGLFISEDEKRELYNVETGETLETSLETYNNKELSIVKKSQVEEEIVYYAQIEENQLLWLSEAEVELLDVDTDNEESEDKPADSEENAEYTDTEDGLNEQNSDGEEQETDVEEQDPNDIEETISVDEQEEDKETQEVEEEILESEEAPVEEKQVRSFMRSLPAPEESTTNEDSIDNQVRTLSTRVNSRDIQYQADIKVSGYSIDTVPWGYEGYKKVGDSASHLNKRVNVLSETTNGAYARISLNGKELGWIDKRAFNMVAVEPYKRTIVLSGYSIDSAPWGSSGSYKISDTIDQIFNEITVVGESKSRAYVYAIRNGVGIGWIDKRALDNPTPIDKKVITSETHSIDSAPWGQSGYRQLTTSKANIYQEVDIMLKSPNGAYSLIRSNGKFLGWIDNRALNNRIERTTLSIVRGNHSIDSLPWGDNGYKTIGSTAEYLNKRVDIMAESNNRAYVLIAYNGKQVGWIDKRALSINAPSYPSVIINSGFSIDTLPWGTPGSQRVSSTSNYVSKNVKIVSESNNGAYLLVVENGRELGWVDHRAMARAENMPSSLPVNYSTTIAKAGYSIDTLPWGVNGYQNVNSTSNLLGTQVKVTHHYRSYALVEVNGVKYGWVDQKALGTSPRPQTVSGQQNVYYNAVVQGNYSIDTLPWGMNGYQQVSHTSLIAGRTVKVHNITKGYAYISLEGTDYGWVDRKALGAPTVYIDPGHGGRFSGASVGGVHEKTLNLSTAKILNDMLVRKGYNVIMTRTSDVQFAQTLTPDLIARSRMANNGNAAIFISIHYNSLGVGSSAKGIETFIQNSSYTQNRNEFNTNDPRINSSLRLADTTHNKLISYTGMYNRGVRAQSLNVLRNTDMTAVLYELGFMSNSSELAKVRTRQYQETAARAIADGIDQYFLR